MRITVIAGGSRGDVQPLAAVAQTLDAAGHRVRFAAHSSFEFLVEGTGIQFYARHVNDPRDDQRGYINARPVNPFRKIGHIRRVAHDYGDKGDFLRACESADFIFFSYMSWPAAHVAEHFDVPCAAAYVFPHFRSSEFPRAFGPMFFQRHRFGPVWNRVTHAFMERMTQPADMHWLNEWRKNDLGLPSIELWPDHWAEERRIPRLYGFSPVFQHKPHDWPDWHHVTGYWFWKAPNVWQPPEDLSEFLSAGGPFVFISFSSSIIEDDHFWSEVVIPAVREAGCRAIIGSAWSALHINRAEDLFVIDSCPLDWLFSKVSAIVHAAGASTVAEVMRSGKPSVSIPMFGEQRFCAARIERLGVSPPPLSIKGLSRGKLAHALKQALENDGLRIRADRMGQAVRAEDGAARAAELIEQIARQYTGTLIA
jgi:sterol 3beta-glucosyltransferase